MSTFHQQPGNKNVPEPKIGYEQRKISHHKYKIAVRKGWIQRKDEDGRTYDGHDYILCERKLKLTYDNLITEAQLWGKPIFMDDPRSAADFIEPTKGAVTEWLRTSSLEAKEDVEPIIIISKLQESKENPDIDLNYKNAQIIEIECICSPEDLGNNKNCPFHRKQKNRLSSLCVDHKQNLSSNDSDGVLLNSIKHPRQKKLNQKKRVK